MHTMGKNELSGVYLTAARLPNPSLHGIFGLWAVRLSIHYIHYGSISQLALHIPAIPLPGSLPVSGPPMAR